MPPPYPEVLVREGVKSVQLPLGVRARRKAVNMAVIALSWLHLKRPVAVPSTMRLGLKLTYPQRAVVRRLEAFFTEMEQDGLVGPADMGRTAAKFEGLEDLMCSLHAEVAEVQAGHYEATRLPKEQALHAAPRHQREGQALGRVVGSLKVAAPVIAKPIIASRLSLPREPPLFDPMEFLEDPHRTIYEDPVSLAEPIREGEAPPRVRVHGSAAQKWDFVEFLDSHHRLKLAPEKKVRPALACGAFALGKDAQSDRLILDARPANSVEPIWGDWVKTLGSIQPLLQLELLPQNILKFSGTDLKDYYYSHKVSCKRAYRNCLRMPLTSSHARELKAFHVGLEDEKILYPCLATMAMGDCNAVELGQLCHMKIALSSGIFSPHELLSLRGRAPRGAMAAGVVIDDVLLAEQVPRSLPDSTLTEGVRRLGALCEEYIAKGLLPHPKKTFKGEVQASIWGATVNGESGIVRPAARRLVPLLRVTLEVLAMNVASVALLEVLCGAWMSILQFRRRMMSLLDLCYAAQVNRSRHDVLELSPEMSSELWLLCALAPLAATNLRAQTGGVLAYSDASNEKVAAVRTTLPLEFARELQRHGLSRGAWSRLLTPWQCWKKLHNLGLEDDEELPAGRSSSPVLNSLLQSSLAVHLGSGLYGSYGYVPSLANPGDDPTRGVELRSPSKEMPVWLRSALVGDFFLFDQWVASLGYSPLQLAQVPFLDDSSTDPTATSEMLADLRKVAKPERLARFDLLQSGESGNKEKDQSREHQEPEGLAKKSKDKSPKRSDINDEEGPAVQAVASKEVAPPRSSKPSMDMYSPPTLPRICENGLSPALSAEAKHLLSQFEPSQFFLPGGRRAISAEQVAELSRAGFLDLFSGKAGVAQQLSRRFNVWVICFDFERGPQEDLLDSRVRRKVNQLLELQAVLGVGAAPECASFSRAVWPTVRDAMHPYGKAGITENMQKKVDRGNSHAMFCLSIVLRAIQLGLGYWLENPDGSFLWILPEFLERKVGSPSHSFRFDMCRYGTCWRKRTRVANNLALAGLRELCIGGHSHVRLRGRSSVHKASWTRVAQVYPRGLCKDLATALALKAGLLPGKQVKLQIGACAKCSPSRIGEAAHPGPRRRGGSEFRRDASELVNAPLVEESTLHLQDQVWQRFLSWLQRQLSRTSCQQLFLCPALAAQILERYGIHLFAEGKALYELRHLLVLLQQQKPELRQHLASAWQLVTKWEQVRPLQHRTPLPEILYRAMFSVACLWNWRRWASTLMVGFCGITRVGEALNALRGDLLLPSDNFDPLCAVAFLRIRKPKTRRRGKGRVQHARISSSGEIQFLEKHVAPLDPALKLFPLSAAAFRTRWDKILDYFRIPVQRRPAPSSIRGGGAVAAYRRGVPIQDLLWGMRLASQATLESYLQELAADNYLIKLPEDSKFKIRRVRDNSAGDSCQDYRSGAQAAQIVMKPEFYDKTLEKFDIFISFVGEAARAGSA
eukprot:Skav206346  [mRNA]  locus=scaffold3448:18626:25158:+ [translate_table: standard]